SLGERGGVLRDRSRAHAHGVRGVPRLGHRCAFGVPPLYRDRVAVLQLGHARVHRDRRQHRVCATPPEHPADPPRRRTAHRRSTVTVAILQAGSWGTTLATILGRERVAVLSGPNISREIAAGLPAATVIASVAAETAKHFQALVGTPMFRAYTDTDVVGVELSGALKNIVALGAGAIDGMGYGDN